MFQWQMKVHFFSLTTDNFLVLETYHSVCYLFYLQLNILALLTIFLDYNYLDLEHLFLCALSFFLFQDPMLEIFFAFSQFYMYRSLVLEYLVAFIFLFAQIPWPI